LRVFISYRHDARRLVSRAGAFPRPETLGFGSGELRDSIVHGPRADAAVGDRGRHSDVVDDRVCRVAGGCAGAARARSSSPIDGGTPARRSHRRPGAVRRSRAPSRGAPGARRKPS